MNKIIWLNGMPRSGTSWLSQIFDSCPHVTFKLAPLFSYAFKDRINNESTEREIKDFFEAVYNSNDSFLTQQEKRVNREYPNFKIKNANPKILVIKDTRYHNLTEKLLYSDIDIKFIHIIRNPCAVINSWIKADREFELKGCTIEKDWRNGECRKTGPEEYWGFNDWIKLTSYYSQLADMYPERVMIIQYEKLVLAPFEQTKKMFDFASLPFTNQTKEFLQASLSIKYGGDYSVYRTPDVIDAWRHFLKESIKNEIHAELQNTELVKYVV